MRHLWRYDFQGHLRSGSRSGDDLSPLLGLLSFICSFALHRHTHAHAHTQTHTQPFYGCLILWAGTRKKHSLTHTYRGHQSSLICFLHQLRSMASSLFIYMPDSLFPQSVQVFFGLPLDLTPSTSYSIHFFTQSLSSFHSTCPYHHNLFCCSIKIMSSNSSLSLYPLFVT